jgi:glyoxalase family protein
MSILGLHHITLVATNAQRTVDFYARTLGLRMVKQTVNFDDPSSYHLYFGDETGRPGTAITFFEWPHAPKGMPGIGGTHHFALTVETYDALLKWKRYLTDQGVRVEGPLDRHYFTSLYFRGPDGEIIELATRGPGWAVDEPAESIGTTFQSPPSEMIVSNRDQDVIAARTWPQPVPHISDDMRLTRGMHHISAIATDIERTHAYYHDLLGLRRVKMTSNFDAPESAHWYWGVGAGAPGTLMTYFAYPPGQMRPVRMGAGQTHHVALAVADEPTQLEWREKLIRAGYPVSPVMDRIYFKSIYTRDPDGHIIELATAGPGFAVDEPVTSLGARLMLPPWLERSRSAIEGALAPLQVPEWPPVG